MKLTIYHDGQFWVGVIEVVEEGSLRVGRHVFGVEPKDTEVLEFVNRVMLPLADGLSRGIATDTTPEARVNPKRLARRVAQEMQRTGISTRAQIAIKMERESRKRDRRVITRQQRDELQERKRAIARQKAKDRHRGR